MIELLILIVLQEEKCTIYKIRQNIERKYGFFLNVSFGAIHPAVIKLEKQKFLSVKKSISSGGQRSSVYSITNSGKAYFIELMLADLPDNVLQADQVINIKLMYINNLDDEHRNAVKKTIIDYLELKKILSMNLISNKIIFNDTELKFINYNIQRQSEFIEWVKSNY